MSLGISPNARGPAKELQGNIASNIPQENIRQLRREVVELIKIQPNCELLLSKFIHTYQSQFRKQCRVADYGFSRLQDVIDGLKGVVHVVGAGLLRTVMLTHNIQVRRFTHELLRLLKIEMKKFCPISQLPERYKKVFHKVTSMHFASTFKKKNYLIIFNSDFNIILGKMRYCSSQQSKQTMIAFVLSALSNLK